MRGVQVVVNEQHIARRARSAQLHTWAGLGLMLGGLVVSFLGLDYIAWSYGALFAGLFLFNAGARDHRRFARRPREDEAVAQALRGLDHRFRLVQYLPGVPANHVLITPGGVFVLEARHHFGNITVHGPRYERRWNWLLMIGSLAEGGIGNPARDAERAATAMRAYLAAKSGVGADAPGGEPGSGPEQAQPTARETAEGGPPAQETSEAAADGVPVYPVVLFLHPQAQVAAYDPAVPTLTPRDLKSWLRKQVPRVRLTATAQRRIHQAFEV